MATTPPAAVAAEAQAILGAGEVQLNVFDPITRTFLGWGDGLEADKFEITPDSEIKEKTSKKRKSYGQAIASIPLAKPTKLSIVIAAANRDALALQFQGLLSRLTQGGGAHNTELTARIDRWQDLGARNFAATPFEVKLKAQPATVYNVGTDYVVDYASGTIKFPESGAVEKDAVLLITGNVAATSTTRIRGGTQTVVRCAARFVGVNLVDQGPMRAEVYEAQLRSTNGFDFLANDFNGITLDGTLVIPAGKEEAYFVEFEDPLV